MASGFAGLCHGPDDSGWDPGWQKERSADGTRATVRDPDGRVERHEEYTLLAQTCAGANLVRSALFNREGRLLAVQDPRRLSDTAYDIQVSDASGKLKCVIHHSEVDKGEPYAIVEDWVV